MNGAPLAERFKQRSAYVAQEELFMPTLNAWETLEFQAFLRNRCPRLQQLLPTRGSCAYACWIRAGRNSAHPSLVSGTALGCSWGQSMVVQDAQDASGLGTPGPTAGKQQARL